MIDGEQQEQERKVLNEFLFFTDRCGLPVSGDNQKIRKAHSNDDMPDINEWPWEHVLEPLALAQHHGIPTRLLDFTYNPMTAAFFSVHSAWQDMGRPSLNEEITSDKYVAVWAVYMHIIFKALKRARDKNDKPRIVIVTVPRADNSYLHHQDGFFILDKEADRKGYPNLEQVLQELCPD